MVTTFYEIKDAAGTVAAIHKRTDGPGGKSVSWLRPDGTVGLNGTPTSALPLYGAHLSDTWPADRAVVVCEGEKCADALQALGIPAVGTVTGAPGTPSADVLAVLEGRVVILAPDNDDVGRAHMRRLAELLVDIAAVGWLEPPDGKPKGWDLADAVAEGMDVRALLATATPCDISDIGDQSPPSDPLMSPRSLMSQPMAWPSPLAVEALHGPAGRFVNAVAPASEADPAAILMQYLAMAGCLVGHATYAMAGDAEHPARLYVLTVGPTGKGRKDTAGRPARRLVTLADPDFSSRIVEGLSSGEGVIFAVRDAVEKLVQVGRGEEKRTELQVVDEGVDDKRLLVRESEFASVLRVSQREGNTLSATIRRAWESDELRTLPRHNPVTATGAHVVITGNVTRDELLRYLDRTELASGFVNRFLVCAAKRAQVLPDGEGVPEDVLAPMAQELRDVVAWAQTPRLLHRDEQARAMWHAVYPRLSEGEPGMYGAATNRAEAQVLRLSVLYAILDRSEVIAAPHLLAALAVWEYAAASARWLFGDATGDPTADTIMSALRVRGSLDRTAIRDLFGRHVERARIEQALVMLEGLGRARRTSDTTTGGRPREVWHAAD